MVEERAACALCSGSWGYCLSILELGFWPHASFLFLNTLGSTIKFVAFFSLKGQSLKAPSKCQEAVHSVTFFSPGPSWGLHEKYHVSMWVCQVGIGVTASLAERRYSHSILVFSFPLSFLHVLLAVTIAFIGGFINQEQKHWAFIFVNLVTL